ncbi:DUF6894 family protein [Mesorhizobium delmotii]|uniref:DUF6894 domain-containing protein n=1 Tax=Mesorhizobium delmotii TaxID=1631247 RepID=A0A2P9ARF4_9HYPH|nr:hypothetical protein [Mesorhizobium delmotii]SJM33693.1 hypothetical protein BQ8482_360094 [Mesorhizobium delmotii]
MFGTPDFLRAPSPIARKFRVVVAIDRFHFEPFGGGLVGMECLATISNYRAGGELYTDDQGLELEELASAKDQALKILAEISQDTLPHPDRAELAISVRDEARRLLLMATLVLEARNSVVQSETG